MIDDHSLMSGWRFGPYRLLERIAKGGLATIWSVSDEAGDTCALRVMHDTFRAGSTGPKLFRRGCEVMSKLPSHPNIVSYISHGVEGPPRTPAGIRVGTQRRDYVALEYIEGLNLRELMVRKDPLLHDILSDLAVELADALEHVHDQGYMHLDIKPENIIISRAGTLYLCDFDTAQQILDKPIKVKKNSGTFFYMPPEVTNGQHVNPTSDIYAFGVTVYELLTGGKPFEGQTEKAMLANQLNARYRIRKIREFNSNIPIGVEQLIHECLDFVPEKRPSNMTALVRELRKAIKEDK